MYTKAMFGQELKKRALKKQDVVQIGIWAHTMYLDYCDQLEPGLMRVMLSLNTMELGSEFEISHEMLNKISDDLIAGKDIDLNSAEYREEFS